MKRIARVSVFLFLACQLLALSVATERPALGYVDPGSGLLMFQVGGSMFAGAMFFLRYRLRKLLGLGPKESVEQANPSMEDASHGK